MKRLGVFILYDNQGIVDDYVVYLLKKINVFLEELVVVCNGTLAESGKKILEQFSKRIYIRENRGFDAAAWQYAFLNIISKNEMKKYDEIILFNDTFFGPIFPMEEVFQKMDEINCDFWGMTAHAESIDPMGTCPYGYWPAHIQTFFLGIRKKMFTSMDFYSYWEKLLICDTFEEVVGKNEASFTKHFEDLGYSWTVYADMTEIDQRESIKATHFAIEQYQLLTEYRMPFYKRKNVICSRNHYLEYHDVSYVKKALDYINERTGYDINLIMKNILRLYDISDLKEGLDLYCIVSKDKEEVKIYKDKKIAIFVYLDNEDLFDRDVDYLKKVPSYIDIVLGTDEIEKKEKLEIMLQDLNNNVTIFQTIKKKSALSAFLVDMEEKIITYEYICFIHDIESAEGSYYTNAYSYSESIWENLLANETYIENVICKFEQNECLGLMTPPIPFHGEYFYTLHHPWGCSYDSTCGLAERLSLKRKISAEKAPISFGNAFWCRTDALKQIFEEKWKYEDFPETDGLLDDNIVHSMEKIYPYVAQENGYYTIEIMTEGQAGLTIDNLRHILKYSIKKVEDVAVGDMGISWTTYMAATLKKEELGIKGTLKHLGKCVLKRLHLKIRRK